MKHFKQGYIYHSNPHVKLSVDSPRSYTRYILLTILLIITLTVIGIR